MPFEDLFEQATVFDLLDELAKQPNQQAITDFSNPNYILVRRLILLMAQIQETEKKHGVKLGGSYQFAIVRNLLWTLEDCTNAGKLKKSLPGIREALLRAMVIQVQADYDVLVPLADEGKGYLERQKKFGVDRWIEKQDIHNQWRSWQAVEESENPNFRALRSKQAKALFLKNKHMITDKQDTIAKQLEPLAPSKRTLRK